MFVFFFFVAFVCSDELGGKSSHWSTNMINYDRDYTGSDIYDDNIFDIMREDGGKISKHYSPQWFVKWTIQVDILVNVLLDLCFVLFYDLIYLFDMQNSSIDGIGLTRNKCNLSIKMVASSIYNKDVINCSFYYWNIVDIVSDNARSISNNNSFQRSLDISIGTSCEDIEQLGRFAMNENALQLLGYSQLNDMDWFLNLALNFYITRYELLFYCIFFVCCFCT